MGEDVELCLDIQVDPASKRILSNPDKCRSALLDVTVVKPKEMEAFGTKRTNTLRADQVRKLIASMEKQRRKKQKFIDKLKYDDTIIKVRKHEDFDDDHRRCRKLFTRHKERISSSSPVDDLERKDFIGIGESVEPLFCEIRRSLKNVETRITNMQDINLVVSQTTVDESASEEYLFSNRKNSVPLTSSNHLKNNAVYRVETAVPDLKSVLLCQNKEKFFERGDKIEGKCLCENCGIVGLLMECQKHPLLSELSESPAPSDCKQGQSRKKRTRFHVPHYDDPKTKNYDDASYINHLSNRVKLLEERLVLQEERIVPKDYIKKIITKMVNNFSPKLFKSKTEVAALCPEKHEKRNIKVSSEKRGKRTVDKTVQSQSSEALHCFHANLNYQTNKQQKASSIKNDKSTITDDDIYYSGNIWRWGEEILRPGIDLKNRIVTLLNDILGKFAITERCTTETAVKGNLTDVGPEYEKYGINPENLKRFMKHMNTKVFNAQIDTKGTFIARGHATHYGKCDKDDNFETFTKPTLQTYRRNHEDHPENTKTTNNNHQSRKVNAQYATNIDVAYVNPKLSLWEKDSPSGFKIEDKSADQRNNSTGKQEFLKIVSKAKQYQKDVLWRNIWNQAKANNQTKEDKITIKIPVQSKDKTGNGMFETELTIGEVEGILRGL